MGLDDPACLYLEPDIVRLLLEHGADPGARDDRGYTPLHVACRNGHTEVAQLLLDHGADPNAPNKYGTTPLDLVLELRHDNPHREEILDLFRKCAPDLVMEAWCVGGPAR